MCISHKINEGRNKMKTHIWGPSAWTFLHAVSFAYPETPSAEHKQAVLNLFGSLKHLLPCGECCSHYCSTFSSESLSKSLSSRDSFSRWLVDFHNSVNVRLQKPEFKYSDAQAKFMGEDAMCEVKATSCADDTHTSSPTPSPFKYLWIGVVIVIALVLFYNQLKKST